MKRYVLGLLVAAVLSAAALAVVIYFLNPFSTGWLGPTLFLTSLYFAVASLTTLLGFVVRVLRSRKEVIFAHLSTAFRQGLLLSLVLVGSLVLQQYRIFNIWSALLFVAAVVLVELAFQSHASTVHLRQAAAPPSILNGQTGRYGKGLGKLSDKSTVPALSDVRPATGPKPLVTRFSPKPPLRTSGPSLEKIVPPKKTV